MAADLGRRKLERANGLGVRPSVPATLDKDLLRAAQTSVGCIVEESDSGASLDGGRLGVEHVM